MQYNELIQESKSRFLDTPGICSEVIKAVKISPLNALNYYKNNETIKQTNTRLLNDKIRPLVNDGDKNMSIYSRLDLDFNGSCVVYNLKAHFDYIDIKQSIAIIFKTVENANPLTFRDYAIKEGLHLEASFYNLILSKTFKKDFNIHFAVIEDEAPHNKAIYKISDNMRISADFELLDLITASVAAIQTGCKKDYEIYEDINGVIELDLQKD